MKILGEKSLSAKVTVVLKVLFVVIAIIDVAVLGIIGKIFSHIFAGENVQSNSYDLITYLLVIITGLIALFIVYEFVKIFSNLRNNNLFCNDNVKRLGSVAIACFIIGIVYIILSIVIVITIQNLLENFVTGVLVFSITLGIIFIVSSVGIKILNEIYKRAIEYKEENDLTI